MLICKITIRTEHDRRDRVRADEGAGGDGRTVRRLAEDQEDPPAVGGHDRRCEERVTHVRGFSRVKHSFTTE